jgi:hypothetical protein
VNFQASSLDSAKATSVDPPSANQSTVPSISITPPDLEKKIVYSCRATLNCKAKLRKGTHGILHQNRYGLSSGFGFVVLNLNLVRV